MEEFNQEGYFTLKEIEDQFEGFISNKVIMNYIEQEKIDGKQHKGIWYIHQSELEKLKDLFINDNLHFIEQHFVDLTSEDFDKKGRILDIGGGGEGVIGQHLGERVVSIDIREGELEEAIENGDNISLKIVMDATDLRFIDNSFETITAFYSLLYIPIEDLATVFNEAYRVLRQDGNFLIWDVIIPENVDKEKQLYALPLDVKINEKTIETNYGVKWDKERTIDTYLNLAKKTGFKIIDKYKDNDIFKIRLKKK